MILSNELTVSVIIPTYNRAALVQRGIESLLSQTRVPDEILVINDGSTDATADILGQYGPPVRVVTQPNLGRSPARNRGLQEAMGDLIAFLDDDDTLTPTSIADRAAFLEAHSAYGAVYTDTLIVDATGNAIGSFSKLYAHLNPTGYIFPHLARYSLFPIHAVMFRRRCIEATAPWFDSTLSYLEDYDFWLRVSANCEFAYIDSLLANYYVHANMTTLQKEKMLLHDLEVHRRIFDMTAFAELSRHEQAEIYSTHGTRLAVLSRMTEARLWYWKAVKADPRWSRPYILSLITLLGSQAYQRIAKMKRDSEGQRDVFQVE